ncbi:MAG: hypothetical protein FJ317_08025 [SAR202 cluster bacterium]|nr:hypothetical protein [SAR202 cluster bacterium]
MNFFGIGGMELLVIILVGFLVLGPARMVRMSRKFGKTMSDVQKTTSEFTNMVETADDDDEEPRKLTKKQKRLPLDSQAAKEADDSVDNGDDEEKPVPFTHTGVPDATDGGQAPHTQA